MTNKDQDKQLSKAIRYSAIWASIWGVKILLIGGSPFLLLISTSFIFFVIYKNR